MLISSTPTTASKIKEILMNSKQECNNYTHLTPLRVELTLGPTQQRGRVSQGYINADPRLIRIWLWSIRVAHYIVYCNITICNTSHFLKAL